MLKDATAAVEAPLGKSVVGDREGRRLRELCQSLLQVGVTVHFFVVSLFFGCDDILF